MENFTIIVVAVLFLLLMAAAVYAVRATRAKKIRDAEERRPVDQGKHVEL